MRRACYEWGGCRIIVLMSEGWSGTYVLGLAEKLMMGWPLRKQAQSGCMSDCHDGDMMLYSLLWYTVRYKC